MIYLVNPDGYTATAETEKRAAWLEAAGFERCTEERWRAAHIVRDLADLARIAREGGPVYPTARRERERGKE